MLTRKIGVRVLIGLVAAASLAYLFARTLSDVSSRPYTVSASHLAPWTFEVGEAGAPNAAVLRMSPPRELSMDLFDQVFQRTMESYATPAAAGIPLVLSREVQGLDPSFVSAQRLVDLAERVGLGSTVPQPHCVAVYRTQGGREHRLFFLLFDFPPFHEFRRELEASLAAAPGMRSATLRDLAPAMLIASSDARRLGEVPSRQELEAACQAPVESHG